jgi:hypothetical protein
MQLKFHFPTVNREGCENIQFGYFRNSFSTNSPSLCMISLIGGWQTFVFEAWRAILIKFLRKCLSGKQSRRPGLILHAVYFVKNECLFLTFKHTWLWFAGNDAMLFGFGRFEGSCPRPADPCTSLNIAEDLVLQQQHCENLQFARYVQRFCLMTSTELNKQLCTVHVPS